MPVPAAPALIAAGALAACGQLSLLVVVSVALAASALADTLWYRAGALNSSALNRFLRRHPDSRVVQIAQRLFTRYGSSSLVTAKFVPGLSLAASPLSGMWGMSLAQFLLFDTLGSIAWSGALVGGGYFFGSAMQSIHVSRWWALLLAAVVGGASTLASVREFWRTFRKSKPIYTETLVHLYQRTPENLAWLARLITCDPTFGLDTAMESPGPHDAANPFFAHWMVAWSRKIAISKVLGKVAGEIRRSALRTALLHSDPVARIPKLPPADWSFGHRLDMFQLEHALAAIDIFPRCTLLLTIFEGVSMEDAAILLDAEKELLVAAQRLGLAELTRNLADEQGWVGVARVPLRSTLDDVQAAA